MAKSYQARRRKRNHTGELTDKLVHIVDKYLQRQAEETRIYVVSTPCEEASTTATTHPQKRTSEEGKDSPATKATDATATVVPRTTTTPRGLRPQLELMKGENGRRPARLLVSMRSLKMLQANVG